MANRTDEKRQRLTAHNRFVDPGRRGANSIPKHYV